MGALEGAIRVAREQYCKDAVACAGVPRVNDQFRAQMAECSDLLVKLETVTDLADLAERVAA
jgi:signal transduction protein with GAF and PtsI domain